MTAQLTDHYGAIDPAAFDADHPVRPVLDATIFADRAESRLWGRTSYVPTVGNRRGLDSGMISAGTTYRVAAR